MLDPHLVPLPAAPGHLPDWLKVFGMEELLDRPVRELARFVDSRLVRSRVLMAPPAVTIREVVVGRQAERAFLNRSQLSDLFRAAVSYLHFQVSRAALEERRRTQWATMPRAEPLARLSRLLGALLDDLQGYPSVWEPLVFSRAEALLHDSPPVYEVTFHGDREGGARSKGPVSCGLHLDEADANQVPWSCNCRTAENEEECVHLRIAVEWLRDAIHDPNHRLHEPLATALGVPGWSRLLANLAQVVPDRRLYEPDERLVWRLGLLPYGRLHLEAAVQRRRPRGGWTKGQQVGLHQVRVGRHGAGEEDRRPAECMAAAELDGYRDDGLGEAVEALCGHPRVFLSGAPETPLAVRRDEPRFALNSVGPDELELGIAFDGLVLSGEPLERCRAGRSHLVRFRPDEPVCVVARVPHELTPLLDLLALAPSKGLPRESLPEVLVVAARIGNHIGLELDQSLGSASRPVEPTPVVRLEPVGDGGLEVALVVRPGSGSFTHPPGEGPPSALGLEGDTVIRWVRDLDSERAAATELVGRLALHEVVPIGPYRYRLAAPEEALDLLLAVRDAGDALTVEWPEGAERSWVGRASHTSLRVRVSRFGQLFGLDGEVDVDGTAVPLAVLLAAVRRGERYVLLGPGRFARLERELRTRLASADRVAVGDGHGAIAVGAAGATRLAAMLGDDVAVEGDDAYLDLLERVGAAGAFEPELPDGLTATLRPYQVDGYRWLARLAQWNAGAVLADDMGLGKTVQALALLVARAPLGPALVVAPTSVCAGWVAEACRFAPGLEVALYRGPGREALLGQLDPGAVLVASFDVVVRDLPRLGGTRFATLVVDEAQAVKNPGTRRARAIRTLDADLAVALTGTPLENHLGELWSIFRVVNPGLLGSWEHFRERFAVPVERAKDPAALADLVAVTRPFLLRRTKAAVAPELPPRTEVVRWVTLSRAERALYEAVRREILEALAGRSGDGERFEMLAALTRLRLLACHPRLEDPHSPVRSSKLETAVEVITNLLEEGQRALVFSQFVRHLALLRAELDSRSVTYLYLDGSTPAEERDRLVRAWQGGSSPLFLLSLKAGGTGLNLMGADCVVHLDPWWNPAVEDQATDRTHRIGQDRPVTVVRLIAADTIEQAVLELHDAKRALARGVLEGAEAAATLSTVELVQLIRADGGASEALDEEPEEGNGDEEAVPGPAEAVEPMEGALDAARLESLVEALAARLEEEVASGRLKSGANARHYEQVARRFLAFTHAELARGEAPRDLAAWREHYLHALGTRRAPGGSSEPAMARTVLNRMARVGHGNPSA